MSAQNYGATYTPISRPTNSNYSQSTTNYYIENQESETEWEEHEITGIYTQAQSLEDIKRSDCIKIMMITIFQHALKTGLMILKSEIKWIANFTTLETLNSILCFATLPTFINLMKDMPRYTTTKGHFTKKNKSF